MTETADLNERLGLEEFNVISLDTAEDGGYIFNAVPKAPDKVCPSCGSTAVVNNGTYNRFLHDMNIDGHKAGINIMGNRHLCRSCGGTFVDNLRCACVKAKITERLKAAILGESGTLGETARKYGISVTTVRRVLSGKGAEAQARIPVKKPSREKAPLIIGIDEARTAEGKYLIAADLEHGKILGLLTGAVDVLGGLKEKERTEYVFTGPGGEYAAAVKRLFPNAKTVICKAQAIERVKAAYSDMRKNIIFEKAMGGVSQQSAPDGKALFSTDYSRLNAAFSVTEDFKEVYRNTLREDAQNAFFEWRGNIPEGFSELRRAADELENRITELLNYFGCGARGEYAEKLHTLSGLLSGQRRPAGELAELLNGADIDSLINELSGK